MHVVNDDERRDVAERLRAYGKEFGDPTWRELCNVVFWDEDSYPTAVRKLHLIDRLADLIEPNYRRDDEWEDWYGGLYHYSNAKTEPTTIREFIEDVLWTAYTVDLGPNGNIDPSTRTDEGCVYTDKLFSEWEREALRLTGIDRDALLALADEMQGHADAEDYGGDGRINAGYLWSYADRIREALGVDDG